MTNEYSLDSTTLKQRIIAMPEDRILFRPTTLNITQNSWVAFCPS